MHASLFGIIFIVVVLLVCFWPAIRYFINLYFRWDSRMEVVTTEEYVKIENIVKHRLRKVNTPSPFASGVYVIELYSLRWGRVMAAEVRWPGKTIHYVNKKWREHILWKS